MNGVNLIPIYRVDARRRRTRGRRWVVACAAYAALLTIGYGMCEATWGGTDPQLASELQAASEKLEKSQSVLARLRPELAEGRARLNAARAVALQPDWSIVLAALAKSLGEEVVLSSCKLDTQTAAAPAPSPAASSADADKAKKKPSKPEPVRVVLSVNGFGRSQVAVSQFVLRLEQMKLFDRVKLIKTSREPFLGGEAVAFQLECLLVGSGDAEKTP